MKARVLLDRLFFGIAPTLWMRWHIARTRVAVADIPGCPTVDGDAETKTINIYFKSTLAPTPKDAERISDGDGSREEDRRAITAVQIEKIIDVKGRGPVYLVTVHGTFPRVGDILFVRSLEMGWLVRGVEFETTLTAPPMRLPGIGVLLHGRRDGRTPAAGDEVEFFRPIGFAS